MIRKTTCQVSSSTLSAISSDLQCAIGLRYYAFSGTELEKFSQAYSKASSLSYAAGIADFDSVNNFSKDDAQEDRNDNSNLAQTKEAIAEAKACLDKLVVMLEKGR